MPAVLNRVNPLSSRERPRRTQHRPQFQHNGNSQGAVPFALFLYCKGCGFRSVLTVISDNCLSGVVQRLSWGEIARTSACSVPMERLTARPEYGSHRKGEIP